MQTSGDLVGVGVVRPSRGGVVVEAWCEGEVHGVITWGGENWFFAPFAAVLPSRPLTADEGIALTSFLTGLVAGLGFVSPVTGDVNLEDWEATFIGGEQPVWEGRVFPFGCRSLDPLEGEVYVP